MRKTTFYHKNLVMEVNIEETTNKNMYMKTINNEIVVLVPKDMPESIVKEFVAKHYKKFVKHIEKTKTKIYISFEQSYFYLFGKKQFFEVISGFSETKIIKKGTKHFIQAITGTEEEILPVIKKYLDAELLKYLEKRLGDFEKIIGLKKHAFKVSNKTHAWGTNFLAKGLITFASNLVYYPKNVIDYVVVHELVHDIHPDHSDRFWTKVEQHAPDFKDLRDQLKADRQIEEL